MFSISSLQRHVIIVLLITVFTEEGFRYGGDFCSGAIFVPLIGQGDNMSSNFMRNPLPYQGAVETASFSKVFPYFSQ